MKVQFTNSFFKSFKKLKRNNMFFNKTWLVLTDELPNFFGNIWRFKKVLWNHSWFDSHYTIEALCTSISILEKGISKRGHEVPESRNKKTEKMRRSLEIMKSYMDDDYIDRAENIIGKLPDHPWDFQPSEDHADCFQLIDHDTPEEKELRSKVYKHARKIQNEEWNELWKIFRGQDPNDYNIWIEENKHNYTQEQIDENVAYYDWFNGDGLAGWWD